MAKNGSGKDHQSDMRELETLKDQLKKKELIIKELEQQSELSEMKSRFLSIASHEFKTPLTGILSSLNLIDRYLDADINNWRKFKNREKVENHLQNINESVKNLTTILDNFLSLRNLEKGEIPVNKINFDIKEMLEGQQVQFQQICKTGQQILYVHKGKKKKVCLDKHLFKNIMNNLLSNAIKFSPENTEIEIISEITGNSLKVEISDQGIGIPAKDQKKVFRRFFRAGNALINEEGTGLGLNIVQKYTELMNGNISFKSTENSGTTFYLTFTFGTS
ncbi:MAG: HAMP domain-containing histidine kinase [Bacteroidetes bacterium]|nr:HAMP domain-containing histidine kinase [Bacteroidota bacterium]